MAITTVTDAQRWRGLMAIVASVGLAGVILGLFAPLIALKLEHRAISTTWNGINAAMPAIAAIVVAPFLPRLTVRFGLLRTILAGVVITVAVVPLFVVFNQTWVWFVLRFVMGVGGMMHWVTTEIWINAAVPDHHRGKVLGANAAAFSAGMASGPLLLGFTGTEGNLPFFIATGIVALGAAPLVFAIGTAPPVHEPEKGAFMDAVRRAPTPMMASLVEGFLFVGLLVLWPIYAMRSGFDEATAITMLTVIVVGQIVASYPIGWLADHMNRKLLLIANGVASLICALLLPVLIGSPVMLYILLFLWGAASAGLYTLGMVRLGETFAARDLGSATAVFILVTQIGSVAGPILGGAGMDAWNPHGFVAVTALVGALFCVFAIWRYVTAEGR
ncbi:MAG: MFS transporter [Alphaproteobacteria bacterium]